MRQIFGLAVVSLALCGASGCSSIVKGTDQQIVVNTDPTGARCEIRRDGQLIAVADPTPQPVTVSKSKNDLLLACSKAGYQTSQQSLPSDIEAMTLGNIVFGGVIGLAVDAGTGALNKYDANITVPLSPAAAAPAVSPTYQAPSAATTGAPTS